MKNENINKLIAAGLLLTENADLKMVESVLIQSLDCDYEHANLGALTAKLIGGGFNRFEYLTAVKGHDKAEIARVLITAIHAISGLSAAVLGLI